MKKSFVTFLSVFVLLVSFRAVAADSYEENVQDLVKFTKLPGVIMLSSVGQDGWPNIRAMINLRHQSYVEKDIFGPDSFETIFLTGKKTKKVQQFLNNNMAGIYYYVPRINTRAVFVFGHIEVIEDPKEMKKYINNENFKQIPSAAKDADLVVLKFNPVKVKSYYRGETSLFDLR